MLRRYICLSRISVGFCHFYVISLFTLSSTAIEGEQLAKFWNKMNWTAVTQPLKRSSWSYLPWVVVNPSGSKYMAILLSNILVTLFQPENRSKAKFEAQWGCPSGGWGGGISQKVTASSMNVTALSRSKAYSENFIYYRHVQTPERLEPIPAFFFLFFSPLKTKKGWHKVEANTSQNNK